MDPTGRWRFPDPTLRTRRGDDGDTHRRAIALLRERGEEHVCALPPLLSRVFGRRRRGRARVRVRARPGCCARRVGRAHHCRHRRITVGTTVGAAVGAMSRLFRGSIAMDDDERHVPERRGSSRPCPATRCADKASIDSHDEVIRLNNFYARNRKIANYGHKVTYLVANSGFRFLQTSGDAGDFVREFAWAQLYVTL